MPPRLPRTRSRTYLDELNPSRKFSVVLLLASCNFIILLLVLRCCDSQLQIDIKLNNSLLFIYIIVRLGISDDDCTQLLTMLAESNRGEEGLWARVNE